MSRFYKKINAFTLSEVLIALTIIGVIAALTIPNLSRNTQAAQYKTAFKKAITEINQIVTEAIAEDGRTFAQAETNDIIDMLDNHLGAKVVSNDNKWSITTNLSASSNAVTANSTLQTYTPAGYKYYTLPDNITLIVPTNISGCGSPHITATGAYTDDVNSGCLAYIDVNGPKSPNIALMGATSLDPASDACAKIVIPPEGEYYVKTDGDNGKYCELTDNAVTDVLPVVLYNDKVYPATIAGYWILNDLIGQTIE